MAQIFSDIDVKQADVEEKEESNESEEETAQEKRLRLTKVYLEQLEKEGTFFTRIMEWEIILIHV